MRDSRAQRLVEGIGRIAGSDVHLFGLERQTHGLCRSCKTYIRAQSSRGEQVALQQSSESGYANGAARHALALYQQNALPPYTTVAWLELRGGCG